ncbi:MAG: SDR family oxidoreductase [bacterium]|nr:SDR family oxidoreductase [bacterium]
MIYPCFENKVALITGGTRGIGRQISELLANSGCHLALVYRRDKRSAQAAESELIKKNIAVHLIQADIADPDQVPEIIASVSQRFQSLDYFVSNAVFGTLKPVGDFTAKRFDVGINANARSYLLLAQAAANLMVPPGTVDDPWEKPEGPLPAKKRMVVLSSLGSQKYIPGYAGIGASKAAIESITRYLAVELAGRGIGVNTVSGGLVRTDSLKAFSEHEQWIQEQIKRTPLGRTADPDDIAKVVIWLLSDQAEWITGQNIIADGGLSLV